MIPAIVIFLGFAAEAAIAYFAIKRSLPFFGTCRKHAADPVRVEARKKKQKRVEIPHRIKRPVPVLTTMPERRKKIDISKKRSKVLNERTDHIRIGTACPYRIELR